MKKVTLEVIYEKVLDLQSDMAELLKTIMEEPELRPDFIRRIRDIDQEKSIMVEDFGKTYGLKQRDKHVLSFAF